ncbi:hypothetical protein [uncultured Chryseobacterium sp.]|uniref:hypothetical protein n=1 Tax=uncultured Chryseobacterium sp. TaxID=259322 RepID=UPI002600CDB5|nr:hypothetical protein [uncultured Chryseobacterium sp.]
MRSGALRQAQDRQGGVENNGLRGPFAYNFDYVICCGHFRPGEVQTGGSSTGSA